MSDDALLQAGAHGFTLARHGAEEEEEESSDVRIDTEVSIPPIPDL